EFAEAVAVCRDGFEHGASYPSLHLTLGRALMESGDLPAARTELEALLQMAPDNIQGERFLGECLEALGDKAGARAQYLKALALAPGDPQLVGRIRAMHHGEAPSPGANGPAAKVTPAADAPALEAPAAPAAPPAMAADDPLASMLDEPTQAPPAALEDTIPPNKAAPEIRVEVEAEPSPPPESDPRPIPLVPVEESFEIERANDIAAG